MWQEDARRGERRQYGVKEVGREVMKVLEWGKRTKNLMKEKWHVSNSTLWKISRPSYRPYFAASRRVHR